MAKSKVQFVSSLIAELTKLSITDDNALIRAEQFISDKIDGYRATVLRKYATDKRNDLSDCYQKIDCLNRNKLGIECTIEGVNIKADADLWEVEIPELLSVSKSIKYFGSFDLRHPYTQSSLSSLSSSFDRWGRKITSFVRIGNKIYYHDCDGTYQFTLIGIFATPSSVCGFKDTNSYPLPKELEQQLELLVKKDLYQMLGIPIDILNDSADDYQSIQKKQSTNENSKK